MVKEKREIIFFISELLTYCGDRRRARRKGRIERGTLGLFYVCVKKNHTVLTHLGWPLPAIKGFGSRD